LLDPDPDPHSTCGSGSFFALLDPDPDPQFECGSGSRRAKNEPQKYTKVQNFHVFKYWMFFFEG